jgi:hypothetical protein
MYPTSVLTPEISRSPWRTEPEETLSSPASMFNTVDLPQPLGPRKVTNSPGRIARFASRTAISELPPLALVTNTL